MGGGAAQGPGQSNRAPAEHNRGAGGPLLERQAEAALSAALMRSQPEAARPPRSLHSLPGRRGWAGSFHRTERR